MLANTRQRIDHDRCNRGWYGWLNGLATDAAAVTAAASLYGECTPEERDALLHVLAEDLPKLTVPAIAVYGPLLSIEADPRRLAKLRAAVGPELPAPAGLIRRALRGAEPGGARLAVLVLPLYLEFVRVLYFRYRLGGGYQWALQQPFALDNSSPHADEEVHGVHVHLSGATTVINELAHEVLVHRRLGTPAPPLLRHHAELFGAHVYEECALGSATSPCYDV